jgi:hypothetical protein
LNAPEPSELALLPKLSAITWSIRPRDYPIHINSLISRSNLLLDTGPPAPGDTKETLTRLLKRAATELPWPELPEGTEHMFDIHLTALSCIAAFGEPEAAVDILSRHVENLERKLVAPSYMAKYYIYRLEWLLSAAVKFESDEGRRDAYVAEAKGLMGRATRSLRDLQSQDWNSNVGEGTPSLRLEPTDCVMW